MKNNIAPNGSNFFNSFLDGQATDSTQRVRGFLLVDFGISSSAAVDACKDVDSIFFSPFLPIFQAIDNSLPCLLLIGSGVERTLEKLLELVLIPLNTGSARVGANAPACVAIAANTKAV